MNNKIIVIIVAILVIAAMILSTVYWKQPVQAPTIQPGAEGAAQQKADTLAPTSVSQDSTTAIDQELNKIDTGNLDKEFQGIDEDIKGL